MDDSERRFDDSSDSECGSCPYDDQCRRVWSLRRRGPYSAVGLSLASVVVFLVPIGTAIAAGAVARLFWSGAGGSTLWEVVAVALGLLIGAALAWLVLPFIGKHFHVRES